MEKDMLERLEGIADWLGSAGSATGPLAHLDSKRCKEAAETIREAIEQSTPDKPCDTEFKPDWPRVKDIIPSNLLFTDGDGKIISAEQWWANRIRQTKAANEIETAFGVNWAELNDIAKDNLTRLYRARHYPTVRYYSTPKDFEKWNRLANEAWPPALNYGDWKMYGGTKWTWTPQGWQRTEIE